MPEVVARVAPLRFVRNLGLVWVCGAVVVGAGWGAMWWGAERKMRASVELRERLGMPVTVEGMRRSIPDGRNAVAELTRAAGAVTGVDSPSTSSDSYHPEHEAEPVPPEWWLRAEQSRAAHGKVFDALTAAGKRPDAELAVNLGAGPMAWMGGLNAWRQLVNVAADEARRRHYLGDDAGAFDLLEGTRLLPRALCEAGTLLHWLVGVAIDHVRVSAVLRMASGLRVGEECGAVSAGRVRGEIAWLLTDERGGLARALAGEAVMTPALLDAELKPKLITPYAEWAKGAATLRLAEGVEEMWVERATEGTHDRAELGWPLGRWVTDVSERGRLASTRRMWAFQRRAAAVALAVALYRAEHGGRWPESEAELVPRYLSEMPADPFGKPGERLEYRLARAGGGGGVLEVTQTFSSHGLRLLGVPEGRRPVVLGRSRGREGAELYRDEEIPVVPSYDLWPQIEGERSEQIERRPSAIDLGWWGSAWRKKAEKKEEEP